MKNVLIVIDWAWTGGGGGSNAPLHFLKTIKDIDMKLTPLIKVIPPKQNLHSDFGKSLYTCNSICVNPRNEIKRGGPHTTFSRGQKSTPRGLYIVLRKAIRGNCTTILRNTKSDVQKSGNIRKGEVINTPGY